MEFKEILKKILFHSPDYLYARLQNPLREVILESNVLFYLPQNLGICKCCRIFEEINGIKIEEKRETFEFIGWRPTFDLWYKLDI